MIRAVFFDFDGTLYDRDAAILEMAEKQFDAFGQAIGVDRSTFIERLVALDGHGHGRTPRLHHALGDLLGFNSDVADRLEAYFRTGYPALCRISKDDRRTLEALRAGGKKLGIVTNGPAAWQSQKIENMSIAPLFDTIVISGMEGVEKPDPRIFMRALERCGVRAGESMFVGDHPVADIKGSKDAGLMPVWKRMPYWEAPSDVLQIDHLGEILPLAGYEIEL